MRSYLCPVALYDTNSFASELESNQFAGKIKMNNAILKDRTRQLAHKVIRLIGLLPVGHPLTSVLQYQLAKSSTSVPANYRAACLASSKRSFCHKIDIVLEECDETLFWLDFIKEEELLNTEELTEAIEEATELTKIFTTSRKTARRNLTPNKQ